MTTTRFQWFFVLMGFVVLSTIGCADPKLAKSKLTGKWKVTNSMKSFSFEFTDTGKTTIYENGKATGTGRWSIVSETGNSMTISVKDDKKTENISITFNSINSINLTLPGFPAALQLQRTTATPEGVTIAAGGSSSPAPTTGSGANPYRPATPSPPPRTQTIPSTPRNRTASSPPTSSGFGQTTSTSPPTTGFGGTTSTAPPPSGFGQTRPSITNSSGPPLPRDLRIVKPSRQFDGHTREVNSVALSPDGSQALSASSGTGCIRLWDVNTGSQLQASTGTIMKMNAVIFARDGQYCVVACEDKKVYVLDVNTWKPVTAMSSHMFAVNTVAVSPDGVNVVSGDAIGKVFGWKLTSGRKLGGFEGARGRVESLAFSPDGKLLMAADMLRNVHVWLAANGQPALSPISQKWPVKSVAFSPDSNLAAAACTDGTISIIDLLDGREKLNIKPPQGATPALNSVTFTADGKSLITAGANNMLRLWEVETGKLLAQFEGHTAPVNQVVVSADGKFALSGSDDKTVRVWEMPDLTQPPATDAANGTGTATGT